MVLDLKILIDQGFPLYITTRLKGLNNLKEMNSILNPIELFKKAQEYYYEKDFENADKTISEYKQYVKYDLFRHVDKRNTNKEEISISVIVVSFGANAALIECIESLMAQEDNEYEIIVVDNGANEEIKRQLNKFPILHISPPINFLPSEGRNIGAYFARGKYLAFLDDDAIAHKNYIKSIKIAWKFFNFSAIRGKILPKTNSGNNSFMGHYDFGDFPIPAILMTEGNMAIRKDVFSKVGGFDPLVFGGEGTELSYRCKQFFPSKDIYYWPGMIIYHDFVRGASLSAKKKRHALSEAYFNYLSPEINHIQAEYSQWYKSRPMKGKVTYDSRNFIRKLRSYFHEKLITIRNMM